MVTESLNTVGVTSCRNIDTPNGTATVAYFMSYSSTVSYGFHCVHPNNLGQRGHRADRRPHGGRRDRAHEEHRRFRSLSATTRPRDDGVHRRPRGGDAHPPWVRRAPDLRRARSGEGLRLLHRSANVEPGPGSRSHHRVRGARLPLRRRDRAARGPHLPALAGQGHAGSRGLRGACGGSARPRYWRHGLSGT